MSRTESNDVFERELADSLRRAADGAPSVTASVTGRAVSARLRRRMVRRAVAGGAAAMAAVVLLVALIQPWQPAARPDVPRAAAVDEGDDAGSPGTPPRETVHAQVPPAAPDSGSRGGEDHSHLIAYLSERGVLGRPLLATAVVAGEPHPVSHAFDARLDLRTVDLDALLQSLGPGSQIRIAGVDVNGG